MLLDKQISARNDLAALFIILLVDRNFVCFCANCVTFQAKPAGSMTKRTGKTHILSLLTHLGPKKLGVRRCAPGALRRASGSPPGALRGALRGAAPRPSRLFLALVQIDRRGAHYNCGIREYSIQLTGRIGICMYVYVSTDYMRLLDIVGGQNINLALMMINSQCTTGMY